MNTVQSSAMNRLEEQMSSSAASQFDDFARSRGKSLWYSAWLLTGDHHKAEDLVQTALAKTYSKFSAMSSAAFEAYVRTTIYRTYVSWWRRRWNSELPTQELPEGELAAIDPTLNIDLKRALSGLPRMQRAVLVMRYFDDLTEAQAAAALGISVGSVKSHASRACTALRASVHLKDHVRQS